LSNIIENIHSSGIEDSELCFLCAWSIWPKNPPSVPQHFAANVSQQQQQQLLVYWFQFYVGRKRLLLDSTQKNNNYWRRCKDFR
jgi:hypothetical protein